MSVEKSKGRVISFFTFQIALLQKIEIFSMVCRLPLQIFRAMELTNYSNFNSYLNIFTI